MVINEVNARGMNPNAPVQFVIRFVQFVIAYCVLHATRAWKFFSVNVVTYAKARWEHHKAVEKFYHDHPKYLEGEADKSMGQKVADFVLLLLTPITWILGLCWKLLVGIKNAIFGGGGHGHGH